MALFRATTKTKVLVFDRLLKVFRGKLVMKPGKHQRSKQRCQDLCWEVQDRVQSFVFRSYTIHELRNQNVSLYWLVPQYEVNNYCVLCTVKAKKGNKNLKQRNLSDFITISLY